MDNCQNHEKKIIIRKSAFGAIAASTFGRSMALEMPGQNKPKAVSNRDESKGRAVRIAVVQQDGNPGQVELNRSTVQRQKLSRNCSKGVIHWLYMD